MGPRRWPWWKVLTCVLGSVLLSTLLAAGWVVWRTDAAWAELDARIDAHLQAEIKRPVRRPVLHARTIQGNAWPHYVRAVAGVQKVPSGLIREEAFYDRDLMAEMAVRDILEAHAPALESLSKGARSASLRYDDLVERLHLGKSRQGTAGHLALIAAWDAWLKLEDGCESAAVERIVDILQFSRDWSEGGIWSDSFAGVTTLCHVERAVMRILRQPATAEGRRTIDRALAALDDSPPDSKASVRRELVAFGAGVRRRGLRNYFVEEVMCAPDSVDRLWWSICETTQRLVALGTLSRMEALMKMSPQDPREGWPQGMHTGRLRHESYVRGPLRELFRESDDFPYRNAQARVRMLRMASQWLSGRLIEPLPDPFGQDLRILVRQGTLHVWSVSYDGIDNGGPDAPASDRARDLRLTVPSQR